MKLVIGGAFQGKLTYAKETYSVQDGWIDGRTCRMEEILECRGINQFHEYVKRMMTDKSSQGSEAERTEQLICDADRTEHLDCTAEKLNHLDCAAEVSTDRFIIRTDSLISLETQAASFVQMLKAKNPQLILVSNELGYGVVPMEKSDRMWRETVGRICTELAKEAEEVVRVVCGLGMRLK